MMNWRVPSIGGNQQSHENSTQSWYSPSANGTNSSPSTPISASTPKASDHPLSPSVGHSSHSDVAGIISQLKDKSVDELRKLLTDEEAYNAFFNSLDQVQNHNSLRIELRKKTLELAKDNLEKEPQISELRNQCAIIRTTELATAQEKINEMEKQKDEILKTYSPSALLDKLQNAIDIVNEESEVLKKQFLDKKIDPSTFLQKYKKLRITYQRRKLLHLAVQTAGGV